MVYEFCFSGFSVLYLATCMSFQSMGGVYLTYTDIKFPIQLLFCDFIIPIRTAPFFLEHLPFSLIHFTLWHRLILIHTAML